MDFFFDGAILGTVLAAVSPAVIVPKMIKFQDESYGTKKQIPQILLAGASVDDIYVIVLFSIATQIAMGNSFNAFALLQIPSAIFLGIGIGILFGLAYAWFFTKYHIRDTTKVIFLISVSFLIMFYTEHIKEIISISGLLAIMTSGMTLLLKKTKLSIRLSIKYAKLWVGAEVLLFVLIGINLDLHYLMLTGFKSILLLLIVLLIRMLGVFISLIGSELNVKEKFFCMISYMPKATVQAAVGSLPLSMGLGAGKEILIIAILSILITAPLGSFLIDVLYKKLLEKEV